MALVSAIVDILQRPTTWDVLKELMIFMTPLWIAVFVGISIGWAWKPNWLNNSTTPNSSSSSSSSSFGDTVLVSMIPSLNSFKFQLHSCISLISDYGGAWFDKQSEDTSSNSESSDYTTSTSYSSQLKGGEKSGLVTEDDLEYLRRLVDEEDGGPAWIQMMDRSTPTMAYQAWRRDPETGPPQYQSRSVYEDATPEMMRDFFWDDNFRLKWDDMLLQAETLEECTTTGTMMVQWVRKFPFFCSDREYIIGRRIWESGRSYYCVTKGVPHPSVPRRNKPRRVDLYYSSWLIRAVESKRGDGQLTACEVVLFHHEDMGIHWEIAKLGVRQGMWGAVKKIDPGLRVYQKNRASGEPLSRCSFMAQINTKVSADYLRLLEGTRTGLSMGDSIDSAEKPPRRSIPRFLVVGGAIALACSLDRGLLTKAVIFGIARRFANLGRRL